MIATIKAEWRKNRVRPAFLVGAALVAGLTVLFYGVGWYQATHPGNSDHPVVLATLYPDQFVLGVLGAGFPLGAALAIVIGALVAGSEYGWGTLKTSFTQGPGRLTVWAGRCAVFMVWMGFITAALFATGAAASSVVALGEGHTITWPAVDQIVKGFGTIWLILAANGAIGLALGAVMRQSAAALGIGLVYLLSVEGIALRFIDSLSNGAYQWVGKLFVDQNAGALLQSFSPAASSAPIGPHEATAVLFAYLFALLVVAAGFLRLRDVA
jgi:ABC-type transport system involved in multi-copper enzyme maturation permease subunit